MNTYETEAELEKVVADFETCRTGRDDFHHAQHLVVTVWYLQQLSAEAARKRMRGSLLRFLNHHSVDPKKYNETLTTFWIEITAGLLRELPDSLSIVEKCNRVIDSLANPRLALEFYSEGLLWSEEARESFVPPDLNQWK